MRLRLTGGVVSTAALAALADIADEYADGEVLLTKRTNLQLRGIDHADGCVPAGLVDDLTAAGFLPSASHELVRNIMMSPMTGRMGGHADLRDLAGELDRRVCAEPELARLAGRFLFVLDDGRGDVGERSLDLGVTAVDHGHVQLRLGSHHWGEVVPLDEAAETLVELAVRFVALAGEGESAVWHVDELPGGGADLTFHHPRDVRTQVTSLPLPYGMIAQVDGRTSVHSPVPDGALTLELIDAFVAQRSPELIVTPWRSIILPDQESPS